MGSDNKKTFEDKRSLKDLVSDTILTLYLIKKSSANNAKFADNTFEAKVRIMKLIFLSEYFMIKKGLKGFNFFYNIYHFGPSSQNVLDLIDDLSDSDLVEKFKSERDHTGYKITHTADSNLQSFLSEDGSTNQAFFRIIDQIIDKYGDLEYNELIKKVYSMNITPYNSRRGKILIREAVDRHSQEPSYRPKLLEKMNKEDISKEFSVSDDWKETFLVLTSPTFNEL